MANLHLPAFLRVPAAARAADGHAARGGRPAAGAAAAAGGGGSDLGAARARARGAEAGRRRRRPALWRLPALLRLHRHRRGEAPAARRPPARPHDRPAASLPARAAAAVAAVLGRTRADAEQPALAAAAAAAAPRLPASPRHPVYPAPPCAPQLPRPPRSAPSSSTPTSGPFSTSSTPTPRSTPPSSASSPSPACPPPASCSTRPSPPPTPRPTAWTSWTATERGVRPGGPRRRGGPWQACLCGRPAGLVGLALRGQPDGRSPSSIVCLRCLCIPRHSQLVRL